jgi:hypothetical protein
MNINIVVFSWPKEYSDIVMRIGYSIPHTREHLNIAMRRILIQLLVLPPAKSGDPAGAPARI